MRSVKEEKTNEAAKYPFLGKGNKNDKDVVVLFTEEGVGTVVYASIEYKLGYHSNGWLMCNFIPFTGAIKLES